MSVVKCFVPLCMTALIVLIREAPTAPPNSLNISRACFRERKRAECSSTESNCYSFKLASRTDNLHHHGAEHQRRALRAGVPQLVDPSNRQDQSQGHNPPSRRQGPHYPPQLSFLVLFVFPRTPSGSGVASSSWQSSI